MFWFNTLKRIRKISGLWIVAVLFLNAACRSDTIVGFRSPEMGTDYEDTDSDNDSDNTESLPFSYILGADLSWIQQDEAAGATYYDKDIQKDIFTILTDYAFNFARISIYVDPAAPGGYAENYDEAFGDLEHVSAMAKRIKAAKMGFMLTFHCSDTGGSAGNQIKPSSWEGHDLPVLEQDIYNHTNSTVKALIENGTRPDIVQIGNEIGQGFVRPEGTVSNPEAYTKLIKAGIAGVKEADSTILVALHHQKGRENDTMINWLEMLFEYNTEFDIIGASTFAETEPDQYETNFFDLASRYLNYRFLSLAHSGDDIEIIHQVMSSIPDSQGMGAFIFGPTRYGTSPIFNCQINCSEEEGSTGGRYDTNDYINLYPQIAERLGLNK